jgi:hypothetical protein
MVTRRSPTAKTVHQSRADYATNQPICPMSAAQLIYFEFSCGRLFA